MMRDQPPIRTLSLAMGFGGEERLLREACECDADAICFDLEDGVPPPDKPQMRETLAQLVPELGADRTIFVRVNATERGLLHDDLEAVVAPGLAGVVLPKVARPEEMLSVSELLDSLEAERDLAPGSTLIVPLLETALGTYLAYDIAVSTTRAAYMGGHWFKGGDPGVSIGYEWTPEGTEAAYIRQKVLLEARAAGIPHPIGSPWSFTHDLDGLRAFAETYRREGYRGLMVASPVLSPVYEDHISIINEVFTPSLEEIAHHQSVLDAFEAHQAAADGRGYTTSADRIVGVSHVEYARSRLDIARGLGLIDG